MYSVHTSQHECYKSRPLFWLQFPAVIRWTTDILKHMFNFLAHTFCPHKKSFKYLWCLKSIFYTRARSESSIHRTFLQYDLKMTRNLKLPPFASTILPPILQGTRAIFKYWYFNRNRRNIFLEKGRLPREDSILTFVRQLLWLTTYSTMSIKSTRFREQTCKLSVSPFFFVLLLQDGTKERTDGCSRSDAFSRDNWKPFTTRKQASEGCLEVTRSRPSYVNSAIQFPGGFVHRQIPTSSPTRVDLPRKFICTPLLRVPTYS